MTCLTWSHMDDSGHALADRADAVAQSAADEAHGFAANVAHPCPTFAYPFLVGTATVGCMM